MGEKGIYLNDHGGDLRFVQSVDNKKLEKKTRIFKKEQATARKKPKSEYTQLTKAVISVNDSSSSSYQQYIIQISTHYSPLKIVIQ